MPFISAPVSAHLSTPISTSISAQIKQAENLTHSPYFLSKYGYSPSFLEKLPLSQHK